MDTAQRKSGAQMIEGTLRLGIGDCECERRGYQYDNGRVDAQNATWFHANPLIKWLKPITKRCQSSVELLSFNRNQSEGNRTLFILVLSPEYRLD